MRAGPAAGESAPATACPGETGWQTVAEIRLAPTSSALTTWDILTGSYSFNRLVGRAERKAEEWLRLDKVEVRRVDVLVEKQYGELKIQTYGGFGPSAENGVLATYPLLYSWVLRSETRERGESSLEFRREFHFW
jgi:hypothetical protein